MNENKYLNTVKGVIANKIGLNSTEVEPTSYIEDDLNIGDLEFVEILGELEELFETDLLDDKAGIVSVSDIVNLISEKID